MLPLTPWATFTLSVSWWKYLEGEEVRHLERAGHYLSMAAYPAPFFSMASRLPMPRYFFSRTPSCQYIAQAINILAVLKPCPS